MNQQTGISVHPNLLTWPQPEQKLALAETKALVGPAGMSQAGGHKDGTIWVVCDHHQFFYVLETADEEVLLLRTRTAALAYLEAWSGDELPSVLWDVARGAS